MIKIAASHEKFLLGLPETGMGYQFVEAETEIRKRIQGVVFNTSFFVELEEVPSFVAMAGIEAELEKIAALRSTEVLHTFKLLPKQALSFASHIEQWLGADVGNDEYAKKGEEFKRFSRFSNDKRVTPNMGLHPGTYATTAEDALSVSTGMEAVRRYALPSPQPASYVFSITPPERTSIKRGFVQPANNQPGGGVEVIFVKGSPDRTVYGPLTILDGV